MTTSGVEEGGNGPRRGGQPNRRARVVAAFADADHQLLRSRSTFAVARCTAMLVLTSSVLHLLAARGAPTPTTTVVLAAMAILCLACARHLWLTPTTCAWTVVALMSLLMLALHPALMSNPATASTPHGQGHMTAHGAADTAAGLGLMHAVSALAVTEALIAAMVVAVRSRRARELLVEN